MDSKSVRRSKKKKESEPEKPGTGLVVEAEVPSDKPGLPPEAAALTVVGIGASAGGLEALSQLLPRLPGDLGLSYVVVQHLSPTYRSMMAQLLSRETQMPVMEIQDNSRPEPNVVYITPPNRNVTLVDGLFCLVIPAKEAMPKPSVNLFFSSLAEQLGENAIGVILSGTGSDGAHGIHAIKASGGFTFAQTPETAKYSGMPQSAVDTGSVDWTMAPEEIGPEIALVIQNRGRIPVATKAANAPATLKTLLAKVRTRTKVDFSQYKEPTLWRRIERRMAANHVVSLAEYLSLVDQKPVELEKLCKDILISVTSFFRDEEAFAALQLTVQRLLKEKPSGEDIRVWVAGCATGEEAYSLAIVFSEELGRSFESQRIQIFATDIDMEAMAIARRGMFPAASLSHLSKDLVKRHFTQHGDQFEISKRIRDLVVFARQDLVQDPPFLRLDLIACRNVLIYFKAELQARLLSVFNYALNPGGMLFLGRSESVYQQDGLFEVVDKDSRIFRCSPSAGPKLPAFRSEVLNSPRDFVEKPQPKAVPGAYEVLLLEAANRYFVPLTILINGKFEIRHIHGPTEGLLNITPGKPAFDLVSLIRKELRTELQVLLRQAQVKRQVASGRPRVLRDLNAKRALRVSVHPVPELSGEALFMVCLDWINASKSDATVTPSANDRELEDELAATKEHLQTLVEELETSNEEMQALNEEIQASNEEMQASNEELEASNEELQSTNEELATVNEELQIKTIEMQQLMFELENVQNSIDYPLVVLNGGLLLARFNSAAAQHFKLTPAHMGRGVLDLPLPLEIEALMGDLRSVISGHISIDKDLKSHHHRSYSLHMTPLVRDKGVPSGVILLFVDVTQLHLVEQAVRETRDRLLSVMNNSVSLMAVKDASGRYTFANPKFESSLGFATGHVLGKTDYQLFPSEMSDAFRENELECMKLRRDVEREETIRIAGQHRLFLVVRFPLFDTDGAISGVCFQATDITEKKHAESQLRLAARVFERSAEGVMVTDDQHKILTINDAFTAVTGYAREEIVGMTPRVLSSGKHPPEYFSGMWAQIKELGWWQGEIWNRRKDGELYLEWLSISTVKDSTGEVVNYVGLFSDITQVRASQSRVEFLATHDDLTGLPNRTLLHDRLRLALSRVKRASVLLAVVFLDLDNFKWINDTLGHGIGDALLKQAAERLRDCVRSGDTVARLGGDEFVLLLEVANREEVELTCDRILNVLSASFICGEHECVVSASIGVSMAPDDSDDPAILMRDADTAMYRAKSLGKNAVQFFTADLIETANRRVSIENGLRKAIESGALFVEYQPQIDVSTGQMVGVEALVRWQTDDGVLAPGNFIPIAEESHLVVSVDRWVLTEVCRQVAEWERQGLTNLRVSVNLSGQHFKRSDTVSQIIRIVSESGIAPNKLCVEVTESVLAEVDRAQRMLAELQSFGLKISIDDFGTGFSSLAYLKRLPISELKVDRSFVDGIDVDPDDRAIAATVVDLARNMNLESLAEGVENAAQLNALKELGCRYAQGFFIARPLSASALLQWMLDREPQAG